MTYFCFVEFDGASVPHMEPLDAETLDAASEEAGRLLYKHASATAAHIFENDLRVRTIQTKQASGL